MPSRARILYVTFDGVLQPLGFSQVVRIVAALARQGFAYHLLSVERTRDLADRSKVDYVERALQDAGATWTTIGVDLARSARRSGEAFARCVAGAFSLVRSHDIQRIHARSYQGAAVANAIQRILGIPYLFDARGCWIDEKADWFARGGAYAVGKFAERRLYAEAEAVITLTDLHGSDVVDGSFGKRDPKSVVTIPTCADYEEFRISPHRPTKPVGTSIVPEAVQGRLTQRLVMGIIGALNRSYLTDQTLALVKHACESRSDAHLLVLTQQESEYERLLGASGVPPDRFTIASARHEDMPSWLGWIDWGLLLLSDTIAKRGSMPTKLAEFFAAGVRPAAYGCNSEVTGWVRRAGSGIVLDAVDERSLYNAAQELTRSIYRREDVERARDVTAPHFSLQAGIARYTELLDRLH